MFASSVVPEVTSEAGFLLGDIIFESGHNALRYLREPLTHQRTRVRVRSWPCFVYAIVALSNYEEVDFVALHRIGVQIKLIL
ncbi:hypothetical protein NDU88_007045 [Pleurodeles waltl]|uniref:Uncharacterized protein n=1 Tax=Pleurodeles waltl TaxID=8319 RepID=A0AAV7PKN6_PLEWA|nr:hypothetical protein NDU88_007045 [Pleurodeles waltl]